MAGRRFYTILGTMVALWVMLFLCPLFSISVQAESAVYPAKRIVRVGIVDTDSKGADRLENPTAALEKGYIQGVAAYADWDCVYVYADWSECVQKLKDGDIDVLLDVLW